ncbi:hypothetical protein COCMIDRAFT_85340 [Bipolaris oryzae ATCC 44560]|uniref:Uncharacterized protein n=1 Tax=Bipolaris oryzae ATCC 44560 TaxID=930090 RepID=W6ZNT9_COCMI|nr:uncharacterized protein COCMIDRAFT_85340 [Bipolaris oryzae ATCC 44560]EUC49169.1 hypothetical protein COCMIDRAFT_85340 [Bipolaris oryzae ATCC 44560]
MNESLNQPTNPPTRQSSSGFSSSFFPPDAPTCESPTDFSSPFFPTAAPTHPPQNDFSSPSFPRLAPAPPPPRPPTSTPAQIAKLQSNLLGYVLRSNPQLLPAADPTTIRLTSKRIDEITHAMWNEALSHGDLLQRACQYGAMYSSLRLAALAKLNFLPSWWFYRDLAIKELKERGWEVDDRDMEGTWEEAVQWCVQVHGRKSSGN